MEKIRKGNDIEVQWAIYAGYGINEAPYDLTGRRLTLYLRNQFGRTEVYDFTVEKHIIKFMVWGKDQKTTGVYSIELVENEGLEGMHTVDECDAFQIVNHSCETGGDTEGRVECVHLQFRANMGITVPAIGQEVKVDSELSLASENPVQNKVITLALENETARAKEAESRLERAIGDYDAKLELMEDKLSVQAEKIDNLAIKVGYMDDKLTKIEDSLEGVDLNAVATVLTKVETMETDLEEVKQSVVELEERVDTLHADSATQGSVDNKIATALDWEEITE